MSFQPYLISSFKSGLTKNKKPFLILDDAFDTLNNCYTWRDSVKKREGIKLVGRLRRVFTSQAAGNITIDVGTVGVPVVTTFNLLTTQLGITGESDANIELGNVTNVVLTTAAPLSQTWTDSTGTGVMTGFGGDITSVSINYATGVVSVVNTGASIGASALTVSLAYYPTLPAMGINKRELAAVNLEETAWFDTKYVYQHDNNHFSSPTAVEWSGTDSNFFWHANYRGSTSDERRFFVTNNALASASTNNRIRHTTNLSTWTDFEPAIAGTDATAINPGIYTGGTTPYGGTLTGFPIIHGSVTITFENDTAGDATVGLRDQFTSGDVGVLNGSPSTNSGTINYVTGVISVSLAPDFVDDATVTARYQTESSQIYQTKLIIPYYGRLLFLNTVEGTIAGLAAGAVNIFNRCRFSQIGNPIQRDAWISTIPGKGGFIDAPTNEAIISARFYKNTLIVLFERSTWQLRYVGEFGLPFLWERISSDFGCESTFSSVLFDNGVMAIGDKSIISSSGNDVQRIDPQIPDTILSFYNLQNGKERVHGYRDFPKELVYWTYSDGGLQKKFPNRVLVYNYENSTYATFRDNITVFGELATTNGISWDEPISWDTPTPWDTRFPAEFPATVSGNQQGFIHWYQYPDSETTADALTNMNDQESLTINAITLANNADIIITSPDHNLEQNEIIFITGLIFIDIPNGTVVTTNLNDRFYQITELTTDTFSLKEWNFVTQQYQTTSHDNIAFTPDPDDGDTYMGGGLIALVQNIDIRTKDFNPFVDQAAHIKMSYTDFMTDATPNSAISIKLFVNSSLSVQANMIVGNTEVETAIPQFGNITNITQAADAQVTSADHGLQSNQVITISEVEGMTEVNGGLFTITYVDDDNFTLGVNSSGFTAYTVGGGGDWITQGYRFYVPGSRYAWHRFYATCFGQYLSYQLFYDDNLMNTIDTHQTGFELNAMMLHLRKGGRLVL